MPVRRKYVLFYIAGTLVFFLVSLTVFFILIPTSSVFAIESKSNNLGITTNPAKQLLKVKNMAPGDKASAPLTVINTGQHNFFYNISAEVESGDKLFAYLNLILSDQNHNVLYSGKLKDLNEIDLGMLGSLKSKSFNVSIGLPIEAGDEYQGVFTSVKFILNAVDQPSSHNCFGPPFCNRNYCMKRGSTTPIKFECYDSDGNLLTSGHNVQLIITGQGLKSGLSYTLGNSLSFDGNHYQANVYADNNLFLDGETYTATVYIGSQIYGQKTFSTEPGNRSNAP